jgi:hypothetical protein
VVHKISNKITGKTEETHDQGAKEGERGGGGGEGGGCGLDGGEGIAVRLRQRIAGAGNTSLSTIIIGLMAIDVMMSIIVIIAAMTRAVLTCVLVDCLPSVSFHDVTSAHASGSDNTGDDFVSRNKITQLYQPHYLFRQRLHVAVRRGSTSDATFFCMQFFVFQSTLFLLLQK